MVLYVYSQLLSLYFDGHGQQGESLSHGLHDSLKENTGIRKASAFLATDKKTSFFPLILRDFHEF